MNIHNFYASSMFKGGLIVSFYKKNFVLHKILVYQYPVKPISLPPTLPLFSILKKLLSSPCDEL